MNKLVIVFFIFMNFFAYLKMLEDKNSSIPGQRSAQTADIAAQSGSTGQHSRQVQERTSELDLFSYGMLGGAFGIWAGIHILNHKSSLKKIGFRQTVYLLMLQNLILYSLFFLNYLAIEKIKKRVQSIE